MSTQAKRSAGRVEKAAADSGTVLETSGVTLRFGGVTSLDQVDLRMRRGEILAVIGPNGAGKTSLFNSLTGAYVPQQGRITFRPARHEGRPHELRGRKPHAVTGLGVARTFQNIRLFGALTALENVQVAAETRLRVDPVSIMLGLPNARRAARASDRRSHEVLSFVGLAGKINELAGALSYGDQRRLEIARGLATDPELLLLDEPAAGTNPTEKLELEQLIRRINSELGVSVLLIEHDMRLVMSVADRVMVLNFGKKIAEGTPAEVQRDPAVVEAYLGAAAEEDTAAVAEVIEQPEQPESSGGGAADDRQAAEGGGAADDPGGSHRGDTAERGGEADR